MTTEARDERVGGDRVDGDRVDSDRVGSTITVRRVHFEWEDTPLHWIPGDPQSTHTMNVLHLLLPAGERWFCRVFRRALPLITEEALRDDVLAFIGQEAVHSRSHAAVVEHLAAQGLDAGPYVRRVEWIFERVLGDEPLGPRMNRFSHAWLVRRVAIVAAIEHFTAVMGFWILESSNGLDEVGADPTMLDLLRWHGAEEVEHRSVAFDLAAHLGASRAGRTAAMLTTFAMMGLRWVLGTRFLMRHDPTRPGRASWRSFRAAGRRGVLPTFSHLAAAVPRYLRADFHPSREGSTEVATAYLARSPAARGA